MTRYHLTAKGEPAVCKASIDACPLGSDVAHKDLANLTEARMWVEKVLAEEYAMPVASKPRKIEAKGDYAWTNTLPEGFADGTKKWFSVDENSASE